MGYGGIEEVEIDEEHGFFYVKREGLGGEKGGYWNRYKIDQEPGFLNWIYDHKIDKDTGFGDIPVYGIEEEEEQIESEDDFQNWNDDPNEDFGSWG